MFKIIVVIFAAAVVAVLGYAATKPNDFRYERSLTIKAPPARLFAQVADLNQWIYWSPYEKKDPQMKRKFGSLTSGKGATYEWDGNNNVGAGRMEILDTVAAEKVVIRLDFFRPFTATNTAEFSFKPVGDSTAVTWAMYGPSNFLSKLMSVFIDCDKMIGNDFDAGLAELKRIGEAG